VSFQDGDIMSEQLVDSKWFQKWTWKIVGWSLLCFLGLSAVNGLLSWILDVELFQNKMGYSYWYFTIFFLTTILYFFYTKFKVNWIGTFSFGLMGLIGIPIELWLEFYTNPVLKSPWAAVGWGIIYILYGLVADLSMLIIKRTDRELVAITVSSLITSIALIFLSVLALNLFYVEPAIPVEGSRDYLLDNWFLIPFSLIQGILGGLLGYFLANIKKKEKEMLKE
jgi:hypothetical protein